MNMKNEFSSKNNYFRIIEYSNFSNKLLYLGSFWSVCLFRYLSGITMGIYNISCLLWIFKSVQHLVKLQESNMAICSLYKFCIFSISFNKKREIGDF